MSKAFSGDPKWLLAVVRRAAYLRATGWDATDMIEEINGGLELVGERIDSIVPGLPWRATTSQVEEAVDLADALFVAGFAEPGAEHVDPTERMSGVRSSAADEGDL